MSKFTLAQRAINELIALIGRGRRRDELENYPAVRELIERNTHLPELVRSITDLSNFSPVTGVDMERGRRRLTDELRRRQRQNRHRRAYLAAAAGVVLIAVLGVWLKREQGEISIGGDILMPMADVPILVLSDGGRVELSAAARIMDGADSIDNRGNMLVYGVAGGTANDKAGDTRRNRIITPPQSRYTVELSDGTHVTLNANSEIDYPVGFGNDERRVSIRGQAFFHVKKDGRPFVVSVGGAEIEVLGTSFDINAHNAGIVTAMLVDGGISVKHGGQIATLTPGHSARVDMIGHSGIEVSVADCAQVTNWMGDVFSYDNMPLELLLGDIANWYGVEFRYNRRAIDNVMVTVHLARAREVESIMANLSTLLKIEFVKKEGNAYEIINR